MKLFVPLEHPEEGFRVLKQLGPPHTEPAQGEWLMATNGWQTTVSDFPNFRIELSLYLERDLSASAKNQITGDVFA